MDVLFFRSFAAIVATALLILVSVLVEGSAMEKGVRPNFFIYPFYFFLVRAKQREFQRYIDEFCSRVRYADRVSVKIVCGSLWMYLFAGFVGICVPAGTRTILIRRSSLRHFSASEWSGVLAHELGHIVESTGDQSTADKFAAQLVGIPLMQRVLLFPGSVARERLRRLEE